jgi:type VI secretion system protein ImpJ
VNCFSNVVWSEGMYLGPHHFQAQSRYFEKLIHFDTSALWFEAYGLVGYRLDAEALQNGTVSLVHARGIFPDGLAFDMPECDPLPRPRNIADLFPPTRDNLTVLLGVSRYRPNGCNTALSAAVNPDQFRYTGETRLLHDENTGSDEKPVRVARKNIRLVLDTEVTEDLVSLPLARVTRDGSGHLVYDPDFIPPCVQIGASETLVMMVRRLIEIMEDKSLTLTSNGARGSKYARDLSAQAVATFWFLHALHSSLAPLRHLCLSKRGHPEELFVELSRLAGALCTFGLGLHPQRLPLYDHQDLQKCFRELDQHIRRQLEAFLPTNCIAIPLQPVRKYFYEADIADQRCLGRARWVFAIQAELGEADLISSAPQLVKICSAQFVPELVKRALPGLALAHLPVPPSALSPRVESQYFAVERTGRCWEHIVKTGRVGVYVPGEFPNPEVELLVLLET